MKTQDLFKFNRSSKRLNETISRVFGKKMDFATFDTVQLEDARNKLRTQIHSARTASEFNETIENEALSQAQWMHDAIVAELMHRQEHIVDTTMQEESSSEVSSVLGRIADDEDFDQLYDLMGDEGPVGKYLQDQIQDITAEMGLDPKDDFQRIESIIMDRIQQEFGGQDGDEGGETDDNYALSSAGFGSDEDYGDYGRDESVEEKAPPGAKAERMVKHIKKGYADDGKLTKKEKGIAYATAWKQHNKEKNEDMNTNEAYINNAKDAIDILADIREQSKLASRGESDPVRPNQLVNDLWDVMQWIEANMNESIETESVKNSGEYMTRLREGEVQQASAIVTAKTMVDRVSRWIEELSGMENDTLLQLGDSIRDEMGQEQAKNFISACAPAIQQALENLKTTRETLATGVRQLTGEEQGAEMLGGEPGAEAGMGGEEEIGAAEPDMMNTGEEGAPEDEFAAAEPAAGGLGDAGREQRESINRSNKLLKVLAG